MILIPEQISYLRNEIITTKENIRGYQDYLNAKDITSGDYSARALIGDSFLDDQFGLEKQKYRDIMYALEHADYKTKRDTEQVEIGTKFTVRFDGDSEEDQFILVEDAYGVPIRDGYVSLNSLLGQSVVGQKENYHFKYTVPGSRISSEKRVITGTITAISKDPKDYKSFIRDKRKSDRISKIYRAKRHELLSNPTPENQEELSSYETITLSQRLLLLLEAERLGRYGRDRNAINRMTIVKKLLETAKVVKPADNGTIEIGSKFELLLDRDGDVETVTAEMINQAVSEEIDGDYIERISPLGTQIYGLRKGDKFTFREGNKVFKGCVASVILPEQVQNEIGYQYHK